jgi:putative Holliday junction resolvase
MSSDPAMTGARKTVVALDYGERRVGVASADTELRMALPHGTVEAKSAEEMLAGVARMCRELGAEIVVVGKPLNMDGSSGQSVQRAETFAAALGVILGTPVEMWDERLSTVAAERAMLDADMSRQRRKRVRDKIAAQIILQSYLDGHAGGVSGGTIGE